ncbi:MAG: nicotinate-nucleotide adenylyltransferase [Xanthobacteraceae bacterium]
MPIVTPRMRIGLLGGSFHPAHKAHRAISLFALKRLQLDRVWWLVSPGNPLKDTSRLAPLAERIAQARKVAASPVIDVTGIEATLGTRYTYDTVSRLRSQLPEVRFVFLMGADILPEFHRWKNWRELAGLIPFAVIDRAGRTFRALSSPAAALARARIPEHKAKSLPDCEPPAWVFLHGLKLRQSSTALRNSTGSPSEG